MIEKLQEIQDSALREIEKLKSLSELEALRVSVLGKKGSLSQLLRGLGAMPSEERPRIGAKANECKQAIESALEERKKALELEAFREKLKAETIDVSLPSRSPHTGSLHLITQTTRKIIDVFSRLGFDVAGGPEVETEFYNFDAVNMPKDHPARDMQDTFFMGPGVVLRTHTSSIQMRAMQARGWPLRVLAPGAVFRSDHDATHSPMFHQVEGVWIDSGVRMSDLRGVLQFFACEMFGSKTQIRFRPSYFPFVEPGCEVDVRFGDQWLEILGAGMVHPKLYELAQFEKSPEGKLPTGFAFGMGVERIAMLLHGIRDLRSLFRNDLRFLKQF
jgi:phenylalanyl-tRNA synthetase alpha chain